MNAHVGSNRPGGIKVSFAAREETPSDEAYALLAALAPSRPKAASEETRPRDRQADTPSAFQSIRDLSSRRPVEDETGPDLAAGDEIIENELRMAARDASYVKPPAAGQREDAIASQALAPEPAVTVEPSPRPGYGDAQADSDGDERDVGMRRILSEEEINRQLEEESEKHGRSRLRTIASRALLGFAAIAVLSVSGYAAYRFTAGSKQETPIAAAAPQKPLPAPAPAPAAVRAQPAPVQPAPMQPPAEPTLAQRTMAGQAAPLPAQLAKPPAPAVSPLPAIDVVRPVDAPAAPPAAAPAPPRPALQVGPISTRLAQISCRSRAGGSEPASLLISAGIWQAAASFNSAIDDVAKWTGQQNGMVLFDSNGRPDLSKIGPNLAVLAYANPGEQVSSANDANAKAWVVVARDEMKDADLGACTMRVIAPN